MLKNIAFLPTKREKSPDYQHCKWGEGRACSLSQPFCPGLWLLCYRACKSVSGPIFGLCSEHLSILSRIIGFIRSQTRRNASTLMIAEANLDDTRSIFVRSREWSTTYWVKRSSDVAFFPCGAVCMESLNSWRLQVRGFVYNVLLFCTSNQTQLSSNVHGVF